jgi:hypothetical protein
MKENSIAFYVFQQNPCEYVQKSRKKAIEGAVKTPEAITIVAASLSSYGTNMKLKNGFIFQLPTAVHNYWTT